MNGKEMRRFIFSADDENEIDTLVKGLSILGGASAYKEYGAYGVIEEVRVDNYDEEKNNVKEAILKYAASKSGIPTPKNADDMARAMDVTAFRDIVNTITTRAIETMFVNYRSPQLDRLVDIEEVDVGDSFSLEIEPKGLPIAQRATYASNVTLVPSYAKSSITITPKVYSLGTSLDFIRIIGNRYDWGRAVARVYAGMIGAQYRLAVSRIYDYSVISGTPLYQANFSNNTFTQLASDVGMLTGGSDNNVMALGTFVALSAISNLATNGGYMVRDEYIRDAYIGKVLGVNTMVLAQMGNFAQPFTTDTAGSVRVIPDNLIVIVPINGDKICKLVRERYVRVREVDANNNNLNRNEYMYFQAFDAKLATASYFGLQGTSA